MLEGHRGSTIWYAVWNDDMNWCFMRCLVTYYAHIFAYHGDISFWWVDESDSGINGNRSQCHVSISHSSDGLYIITGGSDAVLMASHNVVMSFELVHDWRNLYQLILISKQNRRHQQNMFFINRPTIWLRRKLKSKKIYTQIVKSNHLINSIFRKSKVNMEWMFDNDKPIKISKKLSRNFSQFITFLFIDLIWYHGPDRTGDPANWKCEMLMKKTIIYHLSKSMLN